MGALIRPFVAICLLRLGPQDLPASGTLLVVALVAHTVSGVLLSVVTLNAGRAVLAGILDTVLLAGLTASVLYLQRLNVRVVQTLTALAGSGALIGLVALPVTTWLHGAQASGGEAPLAALLLLGLIGWSVAVVGHVLRHALSVPFVLGLVLAVVFYWVSISVLNSLFPFQR